MLSSATQPVKDPQAFAKSYADIVSDIIAKHQKERVPSPWEQVDAGAERMDLTAPGRQKNYLG